ncbi:4Fe-4S binding protein, partial [Planctomycetota bacterium]
MKRLGSTWLSCPARRLIQAVCLTLFLVLFFYVCWPYASDYSQENTVQLPVVELFLILDPLVSISSSIASRALVWSLAAGAIVLLIGVVFPRWFCGYVCPMGTLVDLFDWSISRRIKWFRIKSRGWWINLRFFLLTATFIIAALGVLLSGFVAAIPVVTRGMMYIFAPLQLGLLSGWDSVPPMNIAQYISIFLFLIVLGLGLLRPRFWCAYVCPSGALMSLTSILRLTDRKVEKSCIKCGRCLRICPFDAIDSDFSTRPASCTFCQTCGGVCPTQSIKFVSRWNNVNIKSAIEQPVAQPSYARRRFLFGLIGASGTDISTPESWTKQT